MNEEHIMPRKPKTAPADEQVEDLDVEDVEVEDTTDDEVDTDVEVEDDTDDVDDLEVEDAEEEPEPAPKKTRAKKPPAEKTEKPAREQIQFGSAWLAEHVNTECGTSFNAFGIRTLLRKLVKDGVIQRDVGEDRSRYNFTAGAKDPVVKAVIKAVKSGAAEKAKQEKIEEAKEAAAKKTATTEKKAPTRKAKAKPQPEPEDEGIEDDEDIDDL